MTRPQQLTAKLSDKTVLNEKFTQFSFELAQPHRLEFSAGQYISLALPNEKGERRSYSICSSPENDHGFEILLDITPMGKATQYLNNLKFGEEIQFLAPLGLFTISPELEKKQQPLIFVATGSGIAPYRSMLADQLQQKRNGAKIILYWGLRYVQELFWEEEFEEMETAFPNFQFHPTISQPVPEWTLCRGRVTNCLSVHQQPTDADYFLCGSSAMIDDVIKLLHEKNVPKEKIHRELFY